MLDSIIPLKLSLKRQLGDRRLLAIIREYPSVFIVTNTLPHKVCLVTDWASNRLLSGLSTQKYVADTQSSLINEHVCLQCSHTFTSRNKLFAHIKEAHQIFDNLHDSNNVPSSSLFLHNNELKELLKEVTLELCQHRFFRVGILIMQKKVKRCLRMYLRSVPLSAIPPDKRYL